MAILFTQMLSENDIPKLRNYMIQELKFSSKLVNRIEFLSKLERELDLHYTNFKDVNVSSVYKLAKMKRAYLIEDSLVIDYLGEEFYKPFVDYCKDGFVISGNDLAAEGFKGRGIEDEKIRREAERFKNDYL